MKKIMVFFVSLFILAGCTIDNKEELSIGEIMQSEIIQKDQIEMKIDVAKLSEEEKAIVDLLADHHQQLYDFQITDDVKSIEAGSYQFVDGEWVELYSIVSEVDFNGKGRLSINFDDIKTGAHISVQNRETNVIFAGGSYQQNEEKSQCKAKSFVFLSKEKPIVYNEPIILAIQIGTDKSQFTTSSSFFDDPSQLSQYEEVYGIGIVFNDTYSY